jgi:DNA-binding MarR family transcriptional regulator
MTPDSAALLRLFTEIGILNQLASAAASRQLAPLRLNISEYGLLSHFSLRGDGQTPSDLARVMQVTKPSMTMMLRNLSAKNYVTIAPDRDDARRQRIHVTPAGRAVHGEAADKLTTMAAAATKGLDGNALTAILPTLATLREHLDALRD